MKWFFKTIVDGGWWCKSLHVPTDFVKQIVLSEE